MCRKKNNARTEGSLMMKSQEGEETDEEQCDDPIRLFESDENAVFFGSQPHGQQRSKIEDFRWQLEIPDELRQPSKNSTLRRSSDGLTQTAQGGSISECDFLQLNVKLVDCGKFPWYFKKYSHQILYKTNLNIDSSESDQEIDVGIEDFQLDDCFIVEELQDETIKYQQEESKVNVLQPKSQISKNTSEKRLENMKRREDIEIQKALSQKNIAKIDLKRNQGLIGMKITQKKVKTLQAPAVTYGRKDEVTKVVNIKPKDVMPDKMYISAADEILSHVGTELILIPNQKDSNIITQGTKKIEDDNRKIVTEKAKALESISIQNVPVICSLDETSQKFINSIKVVTTNDSLPAAKIKLEISNGKLEYPKNKLINSNEAEFNSKFDKMVKQPYVLGISSSHVKDVKKTNKYKNSQIKNRIRAHSSLIGLLVSEPNKKEPETQGQKCIKELTQKTKTEVKGRKRGQVDEVPKMSHKIVEKHKNEPNSPILQCSVPKKRKLKHDILPKFKKTDANLNLSKETTNLHKIINKIASISNRERMQFSYCPSKHVTSKSFTCEKPSDVLTKPIIQKEASSLRDKPKSQVNDIQVRSLKVKEVNSKDVNNTNIKPKNFPSTASTTSCHNKKEVSENNLQSVNKDSENNIAIDSRSNKPNVSNGNVLTTVVITPISQFNGAVNSNKYASFPNSSFVQNVPGNNIGRGQGKSYPGLDRHTNKNFHIPVQNRYASTIILKPNQQFNFQANNQPEHPVQTRDLEISTNMPIPVHTQPRYQNHNLHPEYCQSASSGVYPSYVPNYSKNSGFTNKLPPPKNMYQELGSSKQAFCHGGLPQNLVTPLPTLPPLLPPSRSHNPPRSNYDVNQTPHYYPLALQQEQSTSKQNKVITPQLNDSSIIGKNNGGLVKKINIVAVPTTKNVEAGRMKVEEEVKDPQILTPRGKTEVVATKTEMLEELDKLSFADEDLKIHDGTNYTKKNSTFTVEILTKKPSTFVPVKLTVNQKKYDTKIEQPKGYSPPILPIPTYQKVLDRVIPASLSQSKTSEHSAIQEKTRIMLKNEIRPIIKTGFSKCCKRKLSHAFSKPNGNAKKDNLKKISLEEYKKRLTKSDKKSERSNVKHSKEKYNNGAKRPYADYKYRKNVDFSTETDLGYDSDSTVVL